jgi:hypothetical protein
MSEYLLRWSSVVTNDGEIDGKNLRELRKVGITMINCSIGVNDGTGVWEIVQKTDTSKIIARGFVKGDSLSR